MTPLPISITKRRPSTPQRISDVLSPLLTQLVEAKRPTADEVGRLWRRIVGAKAAKHSHPTSLRHGELMIAVDASPWLWHLTLRRPKLLEGFRATWGPDQVTTIRLRIKTA
ncbi:MAG: hypothetical protein A3C53_03605 [Omnitrophica WOR_2 bacterium RIFCSPHIGHO2_02_FULL_68_15]|nr:MAG: hypothetical protein A3C53_03605 [Omnitrophica WOR_2 bacterium RIFCSPHIGHO2_02_FULL_68_15]